MPESPQKPRVPKSDRRGVFRQGGSTPRVDLYARVSTHDQQTLPLQLSAMRDHADPGVDRASGRLRLARRGARPDHVSRAVDAPWLFTGMSKQEFEGGDDD